MELTAKQYETAVNNAAERMMRLSSILFQKITIRSLLQNISHICLPRRNSSVNCGWIAFGSWMVKTNPTIKFHCENQ